MNKINVVTIGGGTGQFSLLNSLKRLENVRITAVVSMVDSGGSTGVLRDQYGVLPPGDILKCLIALSPLEDARTILQTRFREGSLKNHNAGNLLLTFLSQYTNGDFPQAVKVLGEILQIQGTVLPVTIDKATLVAELSDGSRLYGEAAIDIPRGKTRAKIAKTFLVPHHNVLAVYPPVITAIQNADMIVLGPGDLYTSLMPNLLIDEVSCIIEKNKRAQYIYIANLMTKYGETDKFQLKDFISEIGRYVKRDFDSIIINTELPHKDVVERYKHQKAEFIKPPSKHANNIITAPLISEDGGIVRHDVEKLSSVFKTLCELKNSI